MRAVRGSKVVEAAPGRREAPGVDDRRIVVDVGSGDGRRPYEQARRDPEALYIGLDPDAAAPREYAARALRKPSKGGVGNVLFVVGSAEEPPPELAGIADEVQITYPWAALLRGLLSPDERLLRGLASLGKHGARYEIVVTYDASHDHGAGLEPDIGSLDDGAIDRLRGPYAQAGIEIEEWRRLSRQEALAIPSTWGRRLLHGRAREVFLISARRVNAPEWQETAARP